MDDNKTQPTGAESSTATSAAGEPDARVGYCQECGRPLSALSLRRVGNGVFCFPCAAQRQTAAGGWQAVHAGPYPGAMPPPTGQAGPNPRLAGFLGLIPGVGAMYNGQYAKGAMHLVVFVVLVTLADNLSGAFYWFVWGWVFYQAFDAHHTARARRDGTPLPNAFGWNELGERLGFTRPVSEAAPPPPTAAYGTYTPPATPPEWPGYNPPPPPSATPGTYAAYAPEPVSENPYTNPYTSPFPAPEPPPTRPATSTPYEPTYVGPVPATVPGAPTITTSRRFPLGALWLIGLGLLFLLGNLLPAWHISGPWLAPVLLVALAGWSALRRLEQARSAPAGSAGAAIARALGGPLLILTVAVLLTLQAAHIASMQHTWPVLLVVWGFVLLVRRAACNYALRGPVPSTFDTQPVIPPVVRSSSGTGTYGL